MPNIQSAKKRMRQNAKRRLSNRAKISSVRTAEKKLRKLVSAKKIDDAREVLKSFSSLIDRVAKKNIIHKNNASRKKSRLSALIKGAEGSKPAPQEQ